MPGVFLPRSIPSALVAESFGRAAAQYEAEAEVQRHAAAALATHLESLIDRIPDGPVLEVGCGTGFLTRHLSRLFPDRELEVTDLSEGMLNLCRTAIPSHPGGVTFRQADAEAIERSGDCAVIAAGFVGQWFRDPAEGLLRLTRLLTPGGVVAASLPGAGSFPELREACRRAGIDYPGIELPEASHFSEIAAKQGVRCDIVNDYFTEHYRSSLHFFHHLRRIGAAPSDRLAPTPPSAMRALLRTMDSGARSAAGMTPVTYEIIYLILQAQVPGTKDGSPPSGSG